PDAVRGVARGVQGSRGHRLGRRGRHATPRVRARRLRPRDAPAPQPPRPRVGAPNRARARAGAPVVEGSGTGRLEAFSDGVFAIAATLLVLEFTLHASKDLGSDLLHAWPGYLAYAT